MDILRDLLGGQGIIGALDHAKIEGANSREARSADAQAARVAQRAADALRRSRIARQACPRPRPDRQAHICMHTYLPAYLVLPRGTAACLRSA